MLHDVLEVATTDGVADAYLAGADGGGRQPAVLFFMDGIGLRPRLYDMADRLASNGYVVLLPNLFYRHGPAPLIDNLDELLASGDRSALIAAMGDLASSLTPQRATQDTAAYLDLLSAQDSVAPGPVGVVGYCMGGALALRAAGNFPKRVAAAASFHGGRLVTDAEDSPHLLADRIQAELYFGHADQDRSMPAEQIARLNAALDDAGVRYRAEVYSGAKHGYTMADMVVYDQAATERHWTELLSLFSRTLSLA